ncbi:MAG TPA: hypothetical protein V6D19_04915 [Stenomitos sp.]
MKKLRFFLGKLLIRLHSEQNHKPVPAKCSVIRLTRLPKDFNQKGQILAVQLDQVFVLSTDDKKSDPPHLSVWVSCLTTPKQACTFLRDQSFPKVVLQLNVNEIRDIVGYSDSSNAHSNQLDVIWVHIKNILGDKTRRDLRPGAAGHSGVVGLDETNAPIGLSNRQAKNLRKDLRAKLAELASKNCEILNEQ